MTNEHAQTRVLPRSNLDLLSTPAIAHLATVRPDGSLQSNPVWFDWDGTYIRISTTKARQKTRNIEHDPHVALSITDPKNPYRYIEIRGIVERIEDDPERRLIDDLSERYLGKRPYPYHQPDDERIILVVKPTDSSAIAA